MATITLTLTQPVVNMTSVSVPNLASGGALPASNKTSTVQFKDDGGSNTVQLVGTVEEFDNFAREIMKAVRP